MLHTKFPGSWSTGSGEDFCRVFTIYGHIWAWRPSSTCDPDAANKLSPPPTQGGTTKNLALIGQAVSERMFEHCGRRTNAGPLVYHKPTNKPSAQVS